MQSVNNSSNSSSSSTNQSTNGLIPSPYYIDPADNTNLVLVSDLLTGENYFLWSRSMHIALSAKNILGFIDGTLSRPSTGELLNVWIPNNYLVISWMLNSMSKEVMRSVMYIDSAREIWIDLEERFSQRNRFRFFQLRRELTNLAQNQQTVCGYFAKLKTVWEELKSYRRDCSCGKCSCGGVEAIAEYQEVEFMMSFVMGLNDSFSQIRARILLMEPPPSVNKAFALAIQDEEQREIHSRAQNKERPVCSHCKIRGHVVDQCFQLHGYPLCNGSSSQAASQGSNGNIFSA